MPHDKLPPRSLHELHAPKLWVGGGLSSRPLHELHAPKLGGWDGKGVGLNRLATPPHAQLLPLPLARGPTPSHQHLHIASESHRDR